MTENSLPVTEGVEYRGVPGFPDYVVGDDGSVWSRKRKGRGANRKRIGPWKQLRSFIGSHGYLQVGLSKNGKLKTTLVHSIVLGAFIGLRPDGCQSRHLNGNPQDSRLVNLVYGTAKENGEDKIRHGTSMKGTKHPRAKLTDDQVRSIRARYKAGETQTAIAKDYGTPQTNVSLIVKYKAWDHI